MSEAKKVPCGCDPCSGARCNCGCQAAVTQTACKCGPECRCGDACTKKP